jgi:hypothetical protein
MSQKIIFFKKINVKGGRNMNGEGYTAKIEMAKLMIKGIETIGRGMER